MKESCLCVLFRMAKRKHNEVTLKAKYEGLKELDKNRPNKETAIQFNVPRSTLSTCNQLIWTITCWIDCFIVFEFSEQPAEVITDGNDENEDRESNEQIAHPWRNEADEATKTFNRLSLLTEDSGFVPLISKKINAAIVNKQFL